MGTKDRIEEKRESVRFYFSRVEKGEKWKRNPLWWI